MSKIFKASKVILDNKKFKLSNEIFVPVANLQVETLKSDSSDETDESERIKKKKEDKQSEAERVRIETEKLIEEAAIEAREKVEDARIEHERIISDAYDTAKEIFEKAKDEGYNEGYENGLAEGKKAYDSEIEDALNIKNEAIERYKLMLAGAEAEIIDLVINCVEKILNAKIDSDTDYIEGLVKSAIEKCAYTTGLIIRVSEKDYIHAVNIKNKILILVENLDDITIKKDSALQPGSCVIDTIAGSVDSSIWSQFEQIKDIFEDLLKGD